MPKIKISDVTQYVEQNIETFHRRRLDSLRALNLEGILKTKNPYLYKAKNLNTAPDLVKDIVNAYLSSSDEGIFGNWLEGLAIFINRKALNGRKAGIQGIDLDFEREGIRYLVAIKSGPNWANGDQLKKLIDQFNVARKTLKTSGAKVNVCCVNGCCYGKSREKSEYKANGDYYKVCGKRFWELISGEENLFIEIIEPLGKNAKERNEEFFDSYSKMITLFTKHFIEDFCKPDGSINWEKIVRLNSEFTPFISKAKRTNKAKRTKK